MTSVPDLLRTVRQWAGEQNDVRAVGLAGSHARGEASTESDVDLVVIVNDVDRRLTAGSWLTVFGEVNEVAREDCH